MRASEIIEAINPVIGSGITDKYLMKEKFVLLAIIHMSTGRLILPVPRSSLMPAIYQSLIPAKRQITINEPTLNFPFITSCNEKINDVRC